MQPGRRSAGVDARRGFETVPGGLRDPRQRYVRNTMILLLLVSALACGTAATLHALQPDALLVNRIVPVAMALAYVALALRYWRHPRRLLSTLWLGWSIAMAGLAAPTWLFVLDAWGSPTRLVDTLPPFNAVMLPLLLVMVVLGHPRHAWWASGIAWLAIAAPVLAYLLAHPQELWTPRGFDLVIAFGPASVLIPLLIPLLRGVEQRIETLQEDGERL